MPKSDAERARAVFLGLREAGLYSRLRDTAADVWIVADEHSQAPLSECLADAPRCRIVGRHTLRDLPVDDAFRGAHLVVASLDERQLAREVTLWSAARGYSGPVWLLFEDLFVTVSTGDGDWLKARPTCKPPAEIKSYAIVSTPRTGSTMLADLLTGTGCCGRPKEHVRNPVIQLLTHTSFDVHRWAASLLTTGCTPNGFFGTKLISHFLFNAQTAVDVETMSKLQDLFGRPQVIFLHRRDRVSQAVSAYVAKKTDVYFAQTPEQQARRNARLETLRYDFQELSRLYRFFRNQERRLGVLLEGSGLDVTHIDYEMLLEDQPATLRRIVEFLGVRAPLHLDAIKTRIVKLRDGRTEVLALRLREDLRARGDF